MSNNDIQLLTNRLLAALNSNYEVIDMSSVLSVITQLEQTTITTEQLEATRLARFLNLLRKRTWSEPLARRAKDLLKKWRELLIAPARTSQQPPPLPPPQRLYPDNRSLPGRTLHHVSLSQPTSPAVSTSASQRSTPRNYSGAQPSSTMENTSLPEYPCSSTTSMTLVKTVPSTSRKQPNLLSSLSNGGQYRNTANKDHVLRTLTSKAVLQKSSRNIPFPPQQATAKKQQQQQPISFANLIESQLHLPESGGGRSSNTVATSFSIEDNRSQSPLPLPRIPRMQRDRQSPMIIEHSVSPLDLDQNSNPSREGSVVVPAPPSIVSGPASLAIASNNNNTISGCSRLLNGDYAGASLELQDSNSNIAGSIHSVMDVQQRFLGSRGSEHRKSKKHKKDKKRHRQERLQDNVPSGSSQVGSRPDGGGGNVPVLNDETLGVFPMQENLSLSSSSLSMFPNISTTNITVTNSSNRGAGNSSHKLESDLTFAGKFKKTLSSTGGPNVGPVDAALAGDTQSSVPQPASTLSMDNGQETAYPTVINPMKKPKKKNGRSSVVVIESRSCSPFTPIGGNSNDSSTTSSRLSNRDLIEVVNQESQGIDDIQARSLLPQQQQQQHQPDPHHLPQPLKPVEIESSLKPEETKAPKRRGRKKGSKGADAMLAQFNTQLFEGSRLLSLASLSGSKKVKTTKELLADIQSRKMESATSSPTLPSQSRPPSTSSEPSLHSPSTSDACSTNATMSTVARSTPDQNIVSASNFRASGIDDDSGSNSSGATAITDKKRSLGFDDDTKSVVKAEGGIHSIEEDIQKLVSLLPPISKNFKWEGEEEFVCTCTVREVEPQQVEVVLPKSDNEGEAPANLNSFSDGTNETDKLPNVISVSVPSRPRAPSPVKIKLPEKPVKSIFDLDYDEEDDPLRTFVEAAKSCKVKADSVDSGQHFDKTGNIQLEPVISVSLPAPDQHPAAATLFEPAGNVEINGNLELAQPAAASSQLQQPPPQTAAQFEAVEDPDCQAKQRYEIQTNRITKFHVSALHNRFIPNVNGNWDESEAKNLDDIGCDDMTPEGLYVRVVPQYNFLVMDRIPKDLGHVQFKKNYNKIKQHKLERIKMKRKRSCSSSANPEDEDSKQRKKGSENDVKIEAPLPNDAAFDSNMNLNSCTDSLSESGKTGDAERPCDSRMEYSTIEESTFENGRQAQLQHRATDSAAPPLLLLLNQQRSNGSRRSSSCSNSSVNFSSSISCRNNGRKPSNDAGDNSVDQEEDLSYGPSNCSEDHDAEEDDEDDDYDEDEDDDYDGHGDFHEVVTHDMTSSTSTIGNKLVLTIKKTPSKVTPQSSPSLSSPNESGSTSKKRKILDSEEENQKVDSFVSEMAVEPPAAKVGSFSDIENLNRSVVATEEAHEPEPAEIDGDNKLILTDNDAAVVNTTSPKEPLCSSDPVLVELGVLKSSPNSMSHSCSSPTSEQDSDVTDDELPDSNNELLRSFNCLGKENCVGLRVDPNTGKSQQFKEWHEVLQIRSYNDELLTILPYVVID